MSEVKLVLRDASRDLSGTIHGSVASAAVAALSAGPVTIEELNVAIERFQRPHSGRGFCSWFGRGLDDEPHDAGVVVIDLVARLVMVDSSYSSPGPRGSVRYHNGECGTDVVLRYSLEDDWVFLSDANSWRGLAEARRRERAGREPLDVRAVVYGKPLIEFLASECFREFARREEILREVHVKWIERQRDWIESYADGPQPDPGTLSLEELAWSTSPGQERYASPFYDTLKDIHAAWLLTPRTELRGESPREVLLARHNHISSDLQSRCDQWSHLEECPRGLETTSHAFRFGGFGTHELVKYYELVRELLWSCWERLEELATTAKLSQRPESLMVGDFLTNEVPRLERVRDEWFETRDPECHFRTPRSIIDRERARLPEGMSGHDAMVDPDCPCCQMLADMPGPMFWHLDGCNMDNEFAFDIYRRTREEWDEEQRSWAELDRKLDAKRAERKRLGLPNATPTTEPGQSDSVWSNSFSIAGGPEVPLGIRLFGIGGHLAELIADLREAGELNGGSNASQGNDSPTEKSQLLIDELNRDFGNLREVLGQTGGELAEALLEPVLARFSETLARVAAAHTNLYDKCGDLEQRLATFVEPQHINDPYDPDPFGRNTTDEDSPESDFPF